MEQISKEVVLTYETLYEALRKEKVREELQKLDYSFFNHVLNYLREKQSAYDETIAKNDVFSQDEREKLSVQISNIKRMLRDLYDTRERKIVNMAINSSRVKVSIVDTSHLLPEEKTIFQGVSHSLSDHRSGILTRICELRQPTILPLPPKEIKKPEEPKGKKQIKFLDTVEQLVDEELELYGPFAANDIANLPRELAEVLIAQGKAVEQS